MTSCTVPQVLEVTYGTETLDENVKFIENALGKDLRKYFVKEFYKDTVRPIR